MSSNCAKGLVDHGGSGQYIVLVWRYSFDETGHLSYEGHFHRRKDLPYSLRLLYSYKQDIEEEVYEGGFIFRRGGHVLKSSVIGRMFPETLRA